MKLLNTNMYNTPAFISPATEYFLYLDTDLTYLTLPYGSWANPNLRVQIGLIINNMIVGNTATIKVYGSVATTTNALLAVRAVKRIASPTQLTIMFPPMVLPIRLVKFNALRISVQSDNLNGEESGITVAYFIYDISKSLDISTVNEAAPISVDDIADHILETPNNLLATNASGQVAASNMLTAGAVASSILATPANLLSTNVSGQVEASNGLTASDVWSAESRSLTDKTGFVPSGAQNTWYVSKSGSDGDGTNWSTAKTTISAALALLVAGGIGGKIIIGAGTYNEYLDLSSTTGVTLEAEHPGSSIITYAELNKPVITVGTRTTLRGLYISNNYAAIASGTAVAVQCTNRASLRIFDCYISSTDNGVVLDRCQDGLIKNTSIMAAEYAIWHKESLGSNYNYNCRIVDCLVKTTSWTVCGTNALYLTQGKVSADNTHFITNRPADNNQAAITVLVLEHGSLTMNNCVVRGQRSSPEANMEGALSNSGTVVAINCEFETVSSYGIDLAGTGSTSLFNCKYDSSKVNATNLIVGGTSSVSTIQNGLALTGEAASALESYDAAKASDIPAAVDISGLATKDDLTNLNDISVQDILTATGITVGGNWTLAKAIKILTAWSAGKWKDKVGAVSTKQLIDPDDGTTVILEMDLSTSTPYRTMSVKI